MINKFIESEIWLLTIGGGFQRANVYINVATNKERSEFRKKLHDKVINIAASLFLVVPDVPKGIRYYQ